MNIALVAPGFSAREDDWCIPSLLDLVRTFATTDTVTVFTLRYPDTTRPYTVFGARVVPLGGRQVAGLRRYPLLARGVSAIIGAHERNPFDLIHAMWADEPGWVGTAAARRLHVPLIVSVRGGEVERWRAQKYGAQRSWFGRTAVRRSLRHADRWTVGSNYMMQRVLERVPGIDATRGVWAPDGVDLDQFSPAQTKLKLGPTNGGLGLTTGELDPTGGELCATGEARAPSVVGPSFSLVENAPNILSVASLTPIKRHDLLIRAFRHVRNRRPDARLHLVGDGPLRKNLERERDASGLREAVVFHGAQPRHELPRWFRHSAVTVVTSLHEAQCLAAVEAAACGCPILGFPIGILPELGAGCRIVREPNEAALAGALLELLAQDAARQAAGAGARRAAEDLFELRSSVERIRLIYQAAG